MREQNSHMAKANYRQVRLYNPTTRQFLHIGGGFVTTNRHQSWLGTRTHAEKQRVIHAESGMLDGFAIIRLEFLDQGEKAEAL